MDAHTLVAGATGALGREIVAALLARGAQVRALVRDPERAKARLGPALERGVELAHAHVDDAGALARALQGVEVVVSALGGSVQPSLRPWSSFFALDAAPNRRLIAAAEEAGVQRFAYVSVYGAGARGQGAYVDAHTAVEEALAASGLAGTVVRPTGFFSAFAPFVDMARKGPVPVLGTGLVKTNPIADEDLAAVLVEATARGDELVEVGGPEEITRRQAAEAACAAAGVPPRTRSVPLLPVKAAAVLARPFHPRNAALLAFFAHVHEHDCVGPRHGERTLSSWLEARAAR